MGSEDFQQIVGAEFAVLRDVGCLRATKQGFDLSSESLLLFLYPLVAHRLVLAGVRLHLRAIERESSLTVIQCGCEPPEITRNGTSSKVAPGEGHRSGLGAGGGNAPQRVATWTNLELR